MGHIFSQGRLIKMLYIKVPRYNMVIHEEGCLGEINHPRPLYNIIISDITMKYIHNQGEGRPMGDVLPRRADKIIRSLKLSETSAKWSGEPYYIIKNHSQAISSTSLVKSISLSNFRVHFLLVQTPGTNKMLITLFLMHIGTNRMQKRIRRPGIMVMDTTRTHWNS